MSHIHYCEAAGHEWRCHSADCVCLCGTRLEDLDHVECPIELRACGEHQLSSSVPTRIDSERLRSLANLGEMIAAWAEASERHVGLCLLCGESVENEQGLIPGTQIHACDAGRALQARSLLR